VFDLDAVLRAVEGADVVFHVAAKVGAWGPYADFHAINVVGTQNIVEACRRCGVPKLVYTSSPSVVFHGGDAEGVDESVPYPDDYLAHYPKTKAAAERMVLAANSAALATVSIRPHLVWGPGDRHLVPKILDRAKRGRLRLIGSGSHRVDSTYIDNAVDAHLLAAAKVDSGSPCAGRPYFISNGEPLPVADLMNRILRAAHQEPVSRSVSPRVAYAVAAVLELTYGFFRIKAEPLLTRFVVRELATARWFDISAARRDLGYAPAVSIEEGMRRLERTLTE
jgi:nucleoside-diphosphate-sugar epimerase